MDSLDRWEAELTLWHGLAILREVQEAYLALPSVKRRIEMYGRDCKIRWTCGPCPTFRDCERPLPAWEGWFRECLKRGE